jgi:hypothetical protein
MPVQITLAENNSFGTNYWTERRVHCKGWKGCAAQYRKCSKFNGYAKMPAQPQKCSGWKNSL